jgi:caa(3)-type oxidase subunit IV
MSKRPAPGAVPLQYVETSYVAIWLYLALLTGLELAIVYASLDKALTVGLLIGTACAKAALVAMYFMHLRFERRGLALVALCPVLIALILLAAVLPDMATRVYPRHHQGEAAWIVRSLGREAAGGNPDSP